MKRYILLFAISFIVTNLYLQAQSDDKEIKKLIYKAYLTTSKTI